MPIFDTLMLMLLGSNWRQVGFEEISISRWRPKAH